MEKIVIITGGGVELEEQLLKYFPIMIILVLLSI